MAKALYILILATMLSSTAQAGLVRSFCDRFLTNNLTVPVLTHANSVGNRAQPEEKLATLAPEMRTLINPRIAQALSTPVDVQQRVLSFLFSDLFLAKKSELSIAEDIFYAADERSRSSFSSDVYFVISATPGTFERKKLSEKLLDSQIKYAKNIVDYLVALGKGAASSSGDLIVQGHYLPTKKYTPDQVDQLVQFGKFLKTHSDALIFTQAIIGFGFIEITLEDFRSDQYGDLRMNFKNKRERILGLLETLGLIRSETNIANEVLEEDLEKLNPDQVEILVKRALTGLESVENQIGKIDFTWLKKVATYHAIAQQKIKTTTNVRELQKISTDISSLISDLATSHQVSLVIQQNFTNEYNKIRRYFEFASEKSNLAAAEQNDWQMLTRHISVLLGVYGNVDATVSGHSAYYVALQNQLRMLRLAIDQNVAACTAQRVNALCARASSSLDFLPSPPNQLQIAPPPEGLLSPVQEGQ